MKILLILAISSVLLLSVTLICLADTIIGNSVNLSYYFDSNTNAASGTLSFGKKINDTTSGYLGIYYKYYNTTEGSLFDDEYTGEVTIDTCYVSYDIKPQIGTIYLGYYNYYCGTSYVRILSNTISTLKSATGVKLVWPAAENLKISVGCLPKEQKVVKGEKTAYNIGLEYTQKEFGVGVDIVKTGNLDYGYVINSFFLLNQNTTTYLQYGSDQNHDMEKIIGLLYVLPQFPLGFAVEYNFDQEPAGSNLYGYLLSYKLDKNSTLLYIRKADLTETNELRLNITW